jgi:hypothetical protein
MNVAHNRKLCQWYISLDRRSVAAELSVGGLIQSSNIVQWSEVSGAAQLGGQRQRGADMLWTAEAANSMLK